MDNIYTVQYNQLSRSQKVCTAHNEGYALVLAGPGSGKTKVITLRAARLIQSGKSVLTMSFNKMAAEEMKLRTKRLLTDCDIVDENNFMFCTIHSFCFNALKKYSELLKEPVLKIIDEQIQNKIVSEIYYSLTETKVSKEELREIISFISKHNSGIEKDNDKNTEYKIRQYLLINEKYKKYKTDNRLVDFDDMIISCNELLKNDIDFKRYVSSQYDFVQVDEGQDVSPLQMEIIKNLGDNLFVVADDDQSIYGFRGSDPSLLKGFSKEKACVQYYLEQNYRCALDVTFISSEFIKNNMLRFDKSIFTNTDRKGNIVIKGFADETKQAYYSAKVILKSLKDNVSIALLYRNNISALCTLTALIILSVLRGKELPIISITSDYFYDNEFTAFLEMISFKEFDDDVADKIIYKYKITGRRRFFINSIKNAAKMICTRITEDKIEKIIECFKSVFSKQEATSQKSNVTFSTIHSAKGLEYETVIIVDNIQGEFPENNQEINDLEEERRLFYVAMTRAKDNLYILYPEKHYDKVVSPSVFIKETKNILGAYY